MTLFPPHPPSLSFQFSLPLSPPVRCKTRSIGERSSSGHFNYLVPPLAFLFLSLYLPFFNVLSLFLPPPNIETKLSYIFSSKPAVCKNQNKRKKKRTPVFYAMDHAARLSRVRFLCRPRVGFNTSTRRLIMAVDGRAHHREKKKKRKKLTTMELRRSSLLGCYRSSPPKLFVASGGFE